MLEIFSLETERLFVRLFVMADLDTVHAIMNAGFGEEPLAERREWLEWSILNYTALARLYQPPYGDRAVVLKSTQQVVGIAGLVPVNGPFDTLPYFRARSAVPASGLNNPEVGLFWALDPAHRGQGYATEAARALADYAFASLGLKHVVALTASDNTSSIAVMRRLGMVVERNPEPVPEWFQAIGILQNPAARPPTA
jgi:[ribosomal protein S5]-alanine N-acetyltransferase